MLNVPDCKIGFYTEIHEPSKIKYTNSKKKKKNIFFTTFLISVRNKTRSEK